jgi:2-dehydro-3-deoxy-D-arabinonate dehydratase
MKLYRTAKGYLVEEDGKFFRGPKSGWDELILREDLPLHLKKSLPTLEALGDKTLPQLEEEILAPICSQEVWAAGVTYFRSRNARMDESQSSGGGDFYDRVYSAERPELFFKATPHRVVGHRGNVAIRDDAHWSVPEPELALLASPSGAIIGYTIANDMSSRDIEGENPLYLPQAKVYDRSCGLGPGILISPAPDPASTEIALTIFRAQAKFFSDSIKLTEMKRDFSTLLHYLYRNNSFPTGCFLLTGTGIVPPDSFTLMHGDEIHICITGIGTLINTVG